VIALGTSWLATLALAQDPPPPEPPADPVVEVRSPLDRFIEIDRRQRRVYRLGVAAATIGVTTEVIGGLAGSEPVYKVGGALEASGAPIMTYAALRSGLSLHQLDAGPLPWFGFLGSVGIVIDLGASGAANLPGLPDRARQRLALAAIGARLGTYTTAILQQTVNRSGRKRLGLRARSAPRPRRLRVALAPDVTVDRIGLTVQLAER